MIGVRRLPVELGEAPDRGERRTQFVRGVGHEAAHARLRLPGRGLGGRPGLERRLDLGEHAVQRAGEPPDLGARVAVGDPAAEVPPGDGLGGRLDLRQRPQAAPYDHDADDGEQDHQGAADQRLDEGNPAHTPFSTVAAQLPGKDGDT
ncbi:hypothetical protein GCM10027612_85030 [Microbispora bryophytorum subsp. camponoti]